MVVIRYSNVNNDFCYFVYYLKNINIRNLKHCTRYYLNNNCLFYYDKNVKTLRL